VHVAAGEVALWLFAKRAEADGWIDG